MKAKKMCRKPVDITGYLCGDVIQEGPFGSPCTVYCSAKCAGEE